MNEKTANIENFIGVYDNYILPEECDKMINFYEKENKFKNTMNRVNFENALVLQKTDTQCFVDNRNIQIWWENFKVAIYNFDTAFKHYTKTTGADEAYGSPFYFTGMKIQKTLPTEGYHVWHVEHGSSFDSQSRAFVFAIYLNDVEEGGETEFLHFSKRVKPKKGRIVIWPAGFPYVHRGNSPLSGEKYMLTSWMLLKNFS